MERREFIESISCLGGFFAFAGASAGCRTVCDGDSSKAAQKTFENRFPHERLSLSYRHVKIGPLLKAVLAGHLHIAVQDRFSPTAMEYVTGPNFLFNGQEIMFS